MKNSSHEPEEFDVFLCHNNEDKPEIRRIADDLIKEGIKPWLDEREIRPGTFWQIELEKQIANIKSVTVFVGESGIGPWQHIEIMAFIKEFFDRDCPVIPAILPSAKIIPTLPLALKNLHFVDFRVPNPEPLKQLKWGITRKKIVETNIVSNVTELFPEKGKLVIEITKSGNAVSCSTNDIEILITAVSNLAQIFDEVKIIATKSGSIRIFLELNPEDADKIYNAAKKGQLEHLGITEVRLYPSLIDPPDEKQRSQLLIILDRVKEFWINGVLEKSLNYDVLMSLGKQLMEGAIESRLNRSILLPTQRNQLSIGDTRIETVFDATGLLLILGEPGSGKTTSLLELASFLIRRAITDPKERIPIVLNLSSWTNHKTLSEWMSDSLNTIYGVPKELAQEWLNKGYLVPLLDGLDEVKIAQQADCVAAINAYITQADPPGLVVCSRLAEYQWLPERLKLNGAICIEPLSQDQINAYFTAVGSEFSPLQNFIQNDPALQELAQSPLMLNIMSMAYQAASPESMADVSQSLEVRRSQIFDAYVDTMFERKSALDIVFPKEKVIIWLSWLALRMNEQSQSVFLIENIQPEWLNNYNQNICYRWISVLILALIIEISFLPLYFYLPENDQVLEPSSYLFDLFSTTLIIGLSVRYNTSIVNGIIYVLLSMLITKFTTVVYWDHIFVNVMPTGWWAFESIIHGAIIGYGLRTLNTIKSVESLSFSWEIFRNVALVGFTVAGLLFGIYYGQLQELAIGIDVGVVAGMIWGLFFGLVMGFENKIRSDIASPNQGIILSLKNGVLFGLPPVFIFSLGFRSIYGSWFWGLYFGIIAGLTLGLNRGLGAAIKHYVLRLVLCLSGKMPLNYIPLLDYCAKLILLKKVGGGYIFIHRMLLEYFANLGSTSIKSTKH
jgi:eukaryotic-like serine/threonine-protein kinase